MSGFDYYKFRKDKLTEEINRELQFYKPYIQWDIFNPYVNYLKSRIGLDKEEKNIENYQKVGWEEVINMNPDKYLKEMDEVVFKKQWQKLKPFHKIMKIKEFVNNLKYSKKISQAKIDKNKNMIQEEILDGIKKKLFKKNKNEIHYDPEKMKISSIDCIGYDSKKKIYYVEW